MAKPRDSHCKRQQPVRAQHSPMEMTPAASLQVPLLQSRGTDEATRPEWEAAKTGRPVSRPPHPTPGARGPRLCPDVAQEEGAGGTVGNGTCTQVRLSEPQRARSNPAFGAPLRAGRIQLRHGQRRP